MLLVRQVTGPATAEVGAAVIYRVTEWNQADPDPAETMAVHWLVKTRDGSELLHQRDRGPELILEISGTWAGHSAVVMPYLRSPTTRISVTTAVPAQPPAVDEPKTVEVEREGSRLYARINGEPRFYIGSDVRYGSRRGLANLYNPQGPLYQPEDWEDDHGPWAWYLYPTIRCESRGFFTCLNTYDRARFTFGHMQLAAHTPDDNFVSILRQMLQLPAARAYFPDLTLVDGRVHRRTDGGTEILETGDTTAPLQNYLNPVENAVDDAEADRAARIIDWCVRDPALRELNVRFTVEQQRRKLAYYATRLPLDGLVDKLVLVVLDVLHQGRGGFQSLGRALEDDDPFDALLNIGSSSFRERVATLRLALRELEEQDRIGRRVYSRAEGDFVEPEGA
jgi:DNA-binding HxlR family transcriptional regulator